MRLRFEGEPDWPCDPAAIRKVVYEPLPHGTSRTVWWIDVRGEEQADTDLFRPGPAAIGSA